MRWSRETLERIPIRSPNEHRHHSVLKGGEFRQKVMKLKDKSDMTVTEFSEFAGAPIQNVPGLKEHFASRRLVQPAQNVHQSAFSSP
jgi:hypothetical protein